MTFPTDETTEATETPKRSWQERMISGVKELLSKLQEKFKTGASTERHRSGFRIQWYHWIGGILSLILLAAFSFMAGFRHHFAGDTLVRYFQQELGNRFLIYSQIDPIELGVWNASIKRLVLSKNLQEGDVPPVALLELTQIKIPWIPALLSQNLQFSAEAYEGNLQAEYHDPMMSLTAQNLQIDRIPILNIASFLSLKGTFSFQETIPDIHLTDERALLPPGTLGLDMKNVEISLKDLEGLVGEEYQAIVKGITIPPIKLSSLHLEATHGNVIEIQKSDFTGDFTGSIDGKISFNPKKLESSQVKILVIAKPSGAWLSALGPLSVIFQPYLCGEALHIEFVGSLLEPKPRKGRC